MTNKKVNLTYLSIVIALVYFVVILETVMISPVANQLSEFLNVEPKNIIRITIGFNLSGFLAPFLGFNADKYGTKKVMQITLILFILGTGLTSTATSLFQFTAYRFITGIGFIGISSLVFEYTSHFIEYNDRGRFAGIIKAAFAAAVFVSPFYAVFMAKNFAVTRMYFFVSVAALILFFLFLPLPYVGAKEHNGKMIKSIARIFKDWNIIKYLMIIATFSFAGSLYFAYLPFSLDSRGLNEIEIRNVYVFISIATIVASIIILKFSDRLGKLRLIVIGACFALVTLLFLNSPNVILHSTLAVLFVLGLDLCWGLFYTVGAELARKDKAILLSLFGFTTALFNIIGALFGPTIYEIGGFKGNVIVMIVFMAIGTAILFNFNSVNKDALN